MKLLVVLAALALTFASCDSDRSDPDAVEEPVTSVSPSERLSTRPAHLSRCDNPEGFSIAYPKGWHTNGGDVVPECSRFHPRPFQLTHGTDERVAAISARVDPVPFETAISSIEQQDPRRREVTIDGRRAVRLEYESSDRSLWPEGTPIMTYVVDAPDADEERTLFVDTVGLQTFDYERNREILDVMAPTLTFTG